MVASSASSRSSVLLKMAERISITALESLACRHGLAEHVNVQTPPMRGSYNLVYPLTFPDGRKWVARIPDPASVDPTLMQSTVVTVRLICERTSIPIPIIHAYDTSPNNELGMPYELMDFVEGVPIYQIWKDEKIVDDAARRRIFEQIAGYMSQLNALQFDKIGLLQYDEVSASYFVGPYRQRSLSGVTVIDESGPFTTTHAFLSHLIQCFSREEMYLIGLLRLFSFSLPDPKYDGAPFVLSPPDFDSQNVLVDPKTFTITGFIDWSDVAVGPRLGGFARYPAWITRDWDPIVYGWREPNPETSRSESETGDGEGEDVQKPAPISSTDSNASSLVNYEESPEALRRHRDLYLSIYSAIDPENADITRQSHIFEALRIALDQPILAAPIMGPLCSHVFNPEDLVVRYLFAGLECGDWLKSWARISAETLEE